MSHPIPAKALAQHIAVLGKTGSGKSYAIRGVVEQLLEDGARACVIDPTGTWWGLKSSATGKRGAYPVVIFGGTHADMPLGAAHGEALAEIIGTSSTPAILDTSQMKVGERTRFFADFADALVRKNKGPLHLVIDEAHLFAPQGKVSDPQSGAMLHAANNLVSLGRSKGLRIVLITQRPAKLHKDSLTQVETLVAMRLIAPQDRKAVEEWIKDNADQEKGREIISSLATLKTGQAWIWAPELGVLERVTFPRIRTFDSSAAPDDSGESSGPVLAPIDREAIAARLKSVAIEADANDPKKLRARIAELERQAGKPIKNDTSATYKARNEGFQEGKAVGLAAAREAQLALLATVRTRAGAVTRDIASTISGMFANLKPIEPKAAARKTRDIPPVKTPVITGSKPGPAPARPRIAGGNGESKVTRSQQKLLDKLAWLEGHSLYPAPKETLAAVAGVSPTSGGYFNNLGALRSAGFIDYPTPGEVGFTDEGRALAQPSDDPRPVHEHWLDVVTAPQRAILEALIAHHPEPIAKDELAGEVNVSPTSGGYFNNLGRLRTLGAIDYPQRGHVALTRHVMPE